MMTYKKGTDAMLKSYPIEAQLKRISEETNFKLQKPVSEMNRTEKVEAVKESLKYVLFIKDNTYEQPIPIIRKNGIPILPQ